MPQLPHTVQRVLPQLPYRMQTTSSLDVSNFYFKHFFFLFLRIIFFFIASGNFIVVASHIKTICFDINVDSRYDFHILRVFNNSK